MATQSKQIFQYVDTDTELRRMPNGATRYMLNCRTFVTDKGSDGAVENTLGNTEILNPNLPEGDNKCVGSLEDKKNNSIIFLNQNSNSNHGIYRYFPDTGSIQVISIDPKWNFDGRLISSINLVNDLLYFTDNYNPPREINIVKSNRTDKFLEYNTYPLNRQLINGVDATIQYSVKIISGGISGPPVILANPNASTIIERLLHPGSYNNNANMNDVSKLFVQLWNNNTILFGLYVASACNGYIILTHKFTNDEATIVVTATVQNFFVVESISLKTIASNFYPGGAGFREDFINRVKYPFECEPTIVVGQDTTKATNLIQNKVFQFRTQIVYADNEPSALSPISAIASIPGFCGQDSTQSSYNVINVDFNVDRMNDLSVLSIIKYVNIYVREGNLGKFGFVISLTKEQFLASENIYKFYNDGVYQAIDDALSNKLFDSAPLLSASQEFADDRIFDGGITEGYDPICTNDKLTLNYSPVVINKTFSIRGRNFIRNLYGDGHFAFNQAIVSQDNEVHDFGFGGVGPMSPNILSNDILFADYKKYKQIFPVDSNNISIKGFVFYLAGTNFRGVALQGDSSATPPVFSAYPLPVTGGSNERKDRRATSAAVDAGNIWQNYSIDNVPPGRYILRIASHLITNDDLNANNLDWQKTSTNTLAVGGVNGRECLIELLSDGTINVYKSDGTLSNTYPPNAPIGDSSVADLTNISITNFPIDIEASFAVCGYLCDNDTVVVDPVNILDDTRIELSTVNFNSFAPGQYNAVPELFGLKNGGFGNMEFGNVSTDHNGYFFYNTRKTSVAPFGKLDLNGGADAITISDILLSSSQVSKYDWTGVKSAGTTSPWTGCTNSGVQLGIFRNTLASVQANSRTILQGRVTSNGAGVQDVSVITTRGRLAITDANGNYQMYVYGQGGIRADNIIYVLSDACTGSFNPSVDFYNIGINGFGVPQTMFVSPYSGVYNRANPVTTVGSAVSIFNVSASVSLKRGGKYRFGKVYFDYANRSTTTLTEDGLNLTIPFPTQTGNNDGYHKGIVNVDWDIYNLPPDWATHYQWVRTLNGNQQKLLQWAAKTVTYIDDSGATVPWDQATQIKISLDNLTDYASIHVDSQLAYAFEEGDRLVLLKNSAGVFFDNYYDFKIKGIKSGALLDIYIDNNLSVGQFSAGVFFEIYNPSKVVTNEIFYEIGECFPILTNALGIKVHGGLSVNQEYWSFSDNFYDSVLAKLGFVSSNPHGFNVGDTVVVSQYPGYTYSQYNTTATVIAVSSSSVAGFVIVTDLTFIGNTPAEGGSIVRAAHGRFRNGDTWNRLRLIPIASPSQQVPWYVEDYSISDFYPSLDQSIGRINIVDREAGRLVRQSTIRFSNKYIQDTNVNGLSSNEALNEKVLSANYGLINRLVYVRTTLVSIHENSQTVSVELNKNTLRDTGGTQLIAIAEDVISRDYNYQGSLGTQNPESIVVDDNSDIYGIDVSKGIVWTRKINGMIPISEIYNKTYFRNKSNEIKKSGLHVTIPAIYDRGYKQYILSFNGATGVSAETFAFSVDGEKWESFYPFNPEMYGRGRNNEVVAFLNGKLHRQSSGSVYNNFFGVQYTQKIRPIAVSGQINQFRQKVAVGSIESVWINVSTESSDVWSMPIIKTLEGQQSELAKTDFELIENVFYADLLKDKNTPNVDNPLIFGDDLRSVLIDITMENDAIAFSKIYAANFYSIVSEKTNHL